MNTILLISKSNPSTIEWLMSFYAKNNIDKTQVLEVHPEENGITVEQLREVVSLSSRSFSEKMCIVIYGFDTAKELLQNTFLKTLEEHQENLYFVLVSRSIGAILPTITSRCQTIFVHSKFEIRNSNNSNNIKEIIKELQMEKHPLLSAQLKLKPSDKKEKAIEFLEDFISYGYSVLITIKNKVWFAEKLKKALSAKQLIERNYVDPELALDNIFLT